MQKFLLLLILLISSTGVPYEKEMSLNRSTISDYYAWYVAFDLNERVSYAAFEQALDGYYSIEGKKKDILTLIDFTKPSTEERLYVLDLRKKELLYSSYVSHGRNSGENYATSFSNEMGSYMSSLGFYLTDATYEGKNGYSLLLNGLEKGINDKARERAVVIHGAPYSDPSVIQYAGRLGRSQGCPALPLNVSKPIIDTIKEGSVLFIYADDPLYAAHSPVLTGGYAS